MWVLNICLYAMSLKVVDTVVFSGDMGKRFIYDPVKQRAYYSYDWTLMPKPVSIHAPLQRPGNNFIGSSTEPDKASLCANSTQKEPMLT